MLISKNIETKWSGRLQKYYIEKGYIFTGKNTSLTIDIKDLLLNSNCEVDVKCDYCGRIFKKSYDKYNKQREIIRKDCCDDCKLLKLKECNMLVYGQETSIPNKEIAKLASDKLKKDFNIIKESFINKGLILLSEESDYINQNTKLNFICPRHEYESVQTITWVHMQREHTGCKHCSDERRGWGFIVWEKQALKSNDFENFRLYKIKCYDGNETFYKIGITYTSLDKRFTKRKLPYNFEVIEIIESDSAQYIWDLEKELHRKHKDAKLHYKYPLKQFGGYTECFTDLIN